MCKALRGTELNSGSVQVKYVSFTQYSKKRFLLKNQTVTVTGAVTFDCKDSGRAFVNVSIQGDRKATECSEKMYNSACQELRPLQHAHQAGPS